MTDYIVSSTELSSIADAIRQKGGTSASLSFPNEFVTAIQNISGGGSGAIGIVDEPDAAGGTIRHITAVDLSADTVQASYLLQGYTAHNAAGASITGTYQGGGGTATLQSKSVSFTPSETAISSTITSDTGYDGLSQVSISVAAISSDYVGSNVATRSSADLTVSGRQVTAPAGYYANAASSQVAAGSVTIGTQSATINPTVSITAGGEIRSIVDGSATVAPTFAPGYVNSVSAGTVNVSGSSSSQLTTKAATTYTPTTTDQTIASQQYLTGVQTISGDANLVAGNIKSGVSIFGVNGSYTGGGATLQSKSVSFTPSETATSSTVTSDAGYDGLSEVSISVAGISSNYVGSSITRRSSTDMSMNGATVTAPAGYYASAATATIAGGTVTAPSTITATGATVTTGTNSVTFSKSVSVTPSVTTAGYISSGTAGNATVSLTASMSTKAAATITPGTSNQTIASQQYLTGVQTISGDANLVAGNIKSGTSIFGVTGSYTGGGATNFVTGTFTTGSSTSTTGSVTVNYTGSGYPVMLVVTVEDGAYNSNVSGWYNSLTRYAVGQFTITKGVATSTPTYTTSGNANYGVVALIYKNSTSSSTTYSRTSTMTANSYSSSNANGTNTTCVRWKGNGKTISYYVCGGSSSTYGLLASTTYRYYAVYSS